METTYNCYSVPGIGPLASCLRKNRTRKGKVNWPKNGTGSEWSGVVRREQQPGAVRDNDGTFSISVGHPQRTSDGDFILNLRAQQEIPFRRKDFRDVIADERLLSPIWRCGGDRRMVTTSRVKTNRPIPRRSVANNLPTRRSVPLACLCEGKSAGLQSSSRFGQPRRLTQNPDRGTVHLFLAVFRPCSHCWVSLL